MLSECLGRRGVIDFSVWGFDIASRTGISFIYTFLRRSSNYRFSEAGELFPNETLVEEGSHH